ncbi:SIS domain-containing protein [Thorsellia kenyensis]|uniref:SIS domain-containing protein n=1 Tax=Thorsellia kenyensis TaxID=1549888 RepID=A0ABV6CAI6_9GAMM
MQDKIRAIFTENIQTQIACTENLPQQIENAVTSIVNGLIQGHRILCCGEGISSCLAQILSIHLINQYETPRPSLPAFSLGHGHALLDFHSKDSDEGIFAKQVKALGQSNDILFVISPKGLCKESIQAIEAAVTKDMIIIALTGADGGEIAGLLNDNDVEIRILSQNTSRIHEIHHFVINLLAEMIDNSLFNIQRN